MKHLLIRVIFPALILCQLAAAQQNGHQIFLVREAETAPAGDSALAPSGMQRAQCLYQTMKDAGIKQILIDQTKSAQQTADPLAKALKIAPAAIPAIQTQNAVANLIYGNTAKTLLLAIPPRVTTVIQLLHASTTNP